MTDRVAIVTEYPPSTIGGVERFVHFLKAGLTHDRLDIDVYDSSLLPESKKTASFAKQVLSYRIGKEFVKRGEKYDLVITNAMLGWNVHASPAIHIYHGTSAGVVSGMRGLLSPRSYLEAKFLGGIQEKLCGVGKTIVAVSDKTKQEIETSYQLPVRRVILNAVDLDFFRPLPGKEKLREELGLPQDEFLGLFMDSSGLRKGKDVVEEISRSLPQGNKIVAVSRNQFPESPQIIHRSNLPFEILPKLYSACDYFLFPSRYEGCSFAVIEAMACGLPSIISEVGHAAEIKTDPLLARLVCPGFAPEQYRERIELIRDDTELLHSLGGESRMFAESHHGLHRFTEQYEQLFNDVMAGEDLSKSDW